MDFSEGIAARGAGAGVGAVPMRLADAPQIGANLVERWRLSERASRVRGARRRARVFRVPRFLTLASATLRHGVVLRMKAIVRAAFPYHSHDMLRPGVRGVR